MSADDQVATQAMRGRTQIMLEREHVSLQGTLICEYISTQGMLTIEVRTHSRRVGK